MNRWISPLCAHVIAAGVAAAFGIAFGTAAWAGDWSVTTAWTLSDGLAKPESAVHDAASGVLYVSNVNGGGAEKNGSGYIAKVSRDGTLIARDWISGLNAPKGMALADGKLYVADIDALVVVDVVRAAVEKIYAAPAAQFLNDVAVDGQGRVYVSDSKNSRIYRLEGDTLAVWLNDGQVRRPNGLFVEGDRLIVAAGNAKNRKPHRNRYLQAVSLADKAIRPLKDEGSLGRIDGVQADGAGGYFLTDFKAGTLLHYTVAAGLRTLAEVGKSAGAADMVYSAGAGMIYLPVMAANELRAFAVAR